MLNKMENYEIYFEFTYLHAVFIVGSIFTYMVDLILGKFYILLTKYYLYTMHLIQKCNSRSNLIYTYFLDLIVAITYFLDGLWHGDSEGYWYCFTTICLVLLPTIAVQVFSLRWHQMDSKANGSKLAKSIWFIHAALLGVVHR